MTRNPRDTKPLSILLVEDDDGDATAVVRAFRKLKVGNPITRVYDGVEALDLLRSDDLDGLAQPFLILLDVNLPRMNGHEFLKELRHDPDLSHLTVFMLSTSRDSMDIKAAYARHVAGYIVKETAGDDFLSVAEAFGSYWNMIEVVR